MDSGTLPAFPAQAIKTVIRSLLKAPRYNMNNLHRRMERVLTVERELSPRGLQSEQSGTPRRSRGPSAYFRKEPFHVSHLTDQVSSSDFI